MNNQKSENQPEPRDTMRGRAEKSSLKLWLLTEADRDLVATGVLLLCFITLVAIGLVDPTPLQQTMELSDPTETLFQGLITAIITGVALVVTLNQLVLSQELGALGDQRSRMENAMRFRRDLEDHIGTPVSPEDPSSFLKAIIDDARKRADTLKESIGEADNSIKDTITTYADSLSENASHVSDRLQEAEFGTFELLSASLNFNYSWKIQEARRIKHENRDGLSDDLARQLSELEDTLEFFGPAREHIKTLYFQWELVNLSRTMLYTALPSLLTATAMIIYYDAAAISGATFGISNDVLVTSAGTTLSIAPFIIFVVYILRIVTVTKRTLSIGPFILRDDQER